MRRVLLSMRLMALVAVYHGTPLGAQVCAGFAPLDDTRYRVAVTAASYRYANSLGASLAAGGRMFASVSGARTYDKEWDRAAYEVALETGADVGRVSEERSAVFCPIVSLTASFLPADAVMANGSSERRISAAAGVGVAGVAARYRSAAVQPWANVRAVRLWYRRSFYDGFGDRHQDAADTFYLLGAGVGLVFGDRVTVRPGLTVPFGFVDPRDSEHNGMEVPYGRENRELGFDIAVGFNFGKRARH